MQIAVVVATYEWPGALRAVLRSLADQQHRDFEVVVADDGSGADTRAVVEDFERSRAFPIHHVWQEDRGFRAAAIRNRGVAASEAEYLVFLDGDCVVPPDFLRRHAALAEPGYFVRGNRVMLSSDLTDDIVTDDVPAHHWGLLRWLVQYARRDVNRFTPILRLPLGPLRKPTPLRYEGVRTCNLGVWRRDFLIVNGLDESFEGWGFEDTDLAVRLMNAGIHRKEGHLAVPAFHLWHPSREDCEENRPYFEQRLAAGLTWTEQGVSRHLTVPAGRSR